MNIFWEVYKINPLVPNSFFRPTSLHFGENVPRDQNKIPLFSFYVKVTDKKSCFAGGFQPFSKRKPNLKIVLASMETLNSSKICTESRIGISIRLPPK
jgi:hypothetical protein